MNFLKNHPFPVDAHFKCSTVLTFAVKKEELEDLIPSCLSLDTFKDEWAFIAVAMVQTEHLRPSGFSKFFGNDFFLTGYRIFVRYKNRAGKNLRGLYIIKSETDKRKMKIMGNIFTHYNYTRTDIHQTENKSQRSIFSKKSDFNLKIDKKIEEPNLPENSPFKDWKEARKFAGPLPHTFTYNEAKKKVTIILGLRQNWKPKPLSVDHFHFKFLEDFNFKNYYLANAFEVRNIGYHWNKGKTELWQ